MFGSSFIARGTRILRARDDHLRQNFASFARRGLILECAGRRSFYLSRSLSH
jgi:hypothetical protein